MENSMQSRRRRKWWIVLGSMTLVVVSIWLLLRPKQFDIADVTQPQKIMLQAPSTEKQHWIDISLRLSGKIDGTATIYSPYRSSSIVVKDTFDIDLGIQDCYALEFPLEYAPQGVTKGKVTIHYRFYSTSIRDEFRKWIKRKGS